MQRTCTSCDCPTMIFADFRFEHKNLDTCYGLLLLRKRQVLKRMSNLSMKTCPFWNDNNKLTTQRRHIFSTFRHKAVWEGLCPSSRVPYRNKKLHFTDGALSVLHALLVKVLFHILYTFFTLIQEGDAII